MDLLIIFFVGSWYLALLSGVLRCVYRALKEMDFLFAEQLALDRAWCDLNGVAAAVLFTKLLRAESEDVCCMILLLLLI